MWWRCSLAHANLGSLPDAAPQQWDAVQWQVQRLHHGLLPQRMASLRFVHSARQWLWQVWQQAGPAAQVSCTLHLRTSASAEQMIWAGWLDLHTLRFEDALYAVVDAVAEPALALLLRNAALPVSVQSNVLQYWPSKEVGAASPVPATRNAAITVLAALAQVVAAATGGALQVVSDYFSTGPGQHLALCSGAQLRTQPDGALVLSWQQLYDNLHRHFVLCCTHELIAGQPTLRIEPVRYAYDHTQLALDITLTDPVALQLQRLPDDTLRCALLQTGYTTWRSSWPTAGLDIQSSRCYATGVQGAVWDVRSRFIASGYVAAELRALGAGTAAHAHDDATFISACTPMPDPDNATQPVHAVLATDGHENWTLSPWASAVRWWQLAGSAGTAPHNMLWPLVQHQGHVQTSAQLAAAQHSVRGITYAEPRAAHSEADALAQLLQYRNENGHPYASPFLQPVRVQLHTQLPRAQWQAMQPALLGRVRLRHHAYNYEDTYLDSLHYNPVTEQAQFTLIPTRNLD